MNIKLENIEEDKELFLVVNEYWLSVTAGDLIASLGVAGAIIAVVMSLLALRESRRASVLAFLPVITLRTLNKGLKADAYIIEVVNEGHSTAYNVKIKSKYFVKDYDKVDHKMPTIDVLKFEEVGMVKVQSTKILDTSGSDIKTYGYSEEVLIFKLTQSTKKANLLICFKDASGVSYVSKISLYGGEFEVIDAPKVLTLIRRLMINYSSMIGKIFTTIRYAREQIKYILRSS